MRGTTVQGKAPTEDLVSAAKAGDRAAFSELVLRFEKPLRAHVDARIGDHLRATIDADDVVQETFGKAFQAFGGFEWRGDGSFLRWLRAITENVVLRVADRRRSERLFELRRQGAGVGQELTSASKDLRRGERFDQLEEALASLSPDHRRVILLARIEGLQLKEVAEQMSRSVSAVQKLLLRALKELKEAFGDTESLHLPDRHLGIGRQNDAE